VRRERPFLDSSSGQGVPDPVKAEVAEVGAVDRGELGDAMMTQRQREADILFSRQIAQGFERDTPPELCVHRLGKGPGAPFRLA